MHHHLNVQRAEALADRVAELHAGRLTTREIAQRLGVSARTVTRARHRRGIARPPAPVLTATEVATAAALLADGASYGEVGRTLGRCRWTIAKYFPGQSIWPPGSGAAYRKFTQTLDAIPASAGALRHTDRVSA